MVWFKVDDSFPTHPKVLAIPRAIRPAAVGVWTLTGGWCASHLTDGHFTPSLPGEFGGTTRLITALLDSGLWERTESGLRFHDWPDWQPTSDQVEAKRRADRSRQAKGRETQRRRRVTA